MTDLGIAAATGWTAFRAGLIAPPATGFGLAIARELRRGTGFRRMAIAAMLLATFVAPDLVAGYGYSNFSLSLARSPFANEAFVALLIGLKATIVAAIVLYFSPEPPLSPAGRHLLRLGRKRVPVANRLAIHARGEFNVLLPALAVAFLFAFQQFELPSLTGVTAWTVAIFDRQALVPDLSAAARPLAWPLVVEIIALAPVLALVLRSVASNRRAVPPIRKNTLSVVLAWLVAVGAFSLVAAVPFSVLIWEAAPGIGYVLTQTPATVSYWRQVAAGLSFGIPAALLAYAIAVGLLRAVRSPRLRPLGIALLVTLTVPGLCGPLVPSLFAVEWLQRPWLLPLRETPLPVVLVLTAYLLPRAVLLESLAALGRSLSAVHLAKGLRSSPSEAQRRAGTSLLWKFDGFGRYCRVSLLASWGYLDLTAAALLAPTGMEPITVWLYNFMHYGHNASLSAMTLVTVAAPVLLFFAFLSLRLLVLRLFAR